VIDEEAAMAFPWEEVRVLTGKTLCTVRGRTFDIVTVDDDAVEIFVRSTQKPRTIDRDEFERALVADLFTAQVRPQQLRDAEASEANPAYVAAIIHEIVRQQIAG
jgi:hypothetical protein